MLSTGKVTSKILFKDESTLTFTVDNVEKETKPPSLTFAQLILVKTFNILARSEDFSHRKETQPIFVDGWLHGLVQTLHTAYCHHYALKLSVSDFIILIGQGLAKHMERYSQELRKHFVNHEGKQKIAIFRNEFVMGQQNDWSTVFGKFTENIKKRVKSDIYSVVIDDTSVATPNSRIVSEIVLMDCTKDYFDFSVLTMCGIPEVTLEGSREDWEKLRNKVKKLNQMNKDDRLGLNFWLKHLTPVIEKICDTAINKKIDQDFWSGIYKYAFPGSGTPYVSGWITKFFPYLFDKINPFTSPARISTSDLPKNISSVDFVWNYLGTEYGMKFHGGFLSAKYDENTNSVRPDYFWTVVHDDVKKKNKKIMVIPNVTKIDVKKIEVEEISEADSLDEEIAEMKARKAKKKQEDEISDPDSLDLEIAEMKARKAKWQQKEELASKGRKRMEPVNQGATSGIKPELKKTKK